MLTLPETAEPQRHNSPIEAFQGTIRPARTTPLYRLGLAVVAFAMVLLPLVYLTLIGLTAWLVVLHLKNDTWIFSGAHGRSGLIQLVAYLGPAVAGGILVFFMVKPFFAAKTKSPDPISLDPALEPMLFAFVRKVCDLVGAPVPCRIDVDCQVNASASLRRGLWSNALVLTVGLPLVSGLDMRQFAGVLAHEFGHFAQGAGMRLTYIIRHINFWFARVVYERDEWDLKLEHAARESDLRIGVVLHAARGCVWLTRRILWALMLAGNAISCFMMRQMEYDADSYEAKIAGSDTFELTARRLRVLSVATHRAYEDVQQSWASKRLPENLPLLIGHKASSLPAEVLQKISSAADSEKTGWFDTHPCDADRIRAARSLNEAGVFKLAEPASGLFADFAEVSKTVTRHQYQKNMELEFAQENLMPAEEVLRESAASAEADAMVAKYYGTVNISLEPLLIGSFSLSGESKTDLLSKRRNACGAMKALRLEAEKCSAECVEGQRRRIDYVAAYWLAKAGFKVEPKAFGLPAHATSVQEQETAAAAAIQQTSAAMSGSLKKLGPFMAALRERVSGDLSLAAASLTPECASELAEIAPLLAAVGKEMPTARKMGEKLKAFVLLAQNRGNHSNPAQVDRSVSEIAAELRGLVGELQDRLKGFTYPFAHARGQLTVCEYARFEKPDDNDWVKAFQDANAHVERLFALHYRLLGRILAIADAAEEQLPVC